ncbi:MAG: DUF4900 domain-containing protein, partial [Candidatus Omnitrophica bacterium]|nr:DUF4900 domain-containing protein [Candidatus Omnitrophota bacterium]
MKRKEGVILVTSLVIMGILLLLAGVYFSANLTEKSSSETYKYVLQALNLAEAGANQGVSELRKRIRIDLRNNISNITNPSVIRNYVTANNSLGFLRDFANFTLQNNNATFALNGSAEALGSDINGVYNATVIIKVGGSPSEVREEVFVFSYHYMVEARGGITNITPSIEKTVRLLNGSFNVTVMRDNYARYALFTNHQRTPAGTIVWFTENTRFTGPVHTNERFSFANNPSGSFSDRVTQHLTTARFYNNGWYRLLDAESNPPYDVPVFQKGFERGAELINLPSSVTQQDLKTQATGNQNDAPWPQGIYLPNSNGNLVGGIYIKGDAGMLTMGVDENNRPVYTITRGTNTKNITIDYAAKQTIVTDVTGSGGTSAGTYNGIPDGIGNEGIIIYGNGRIYNLSGTVQQDTKLIVSSDSDIVINNHIMYQQYTPDNPQTPENELSAEGYINLLGILTWNGNVRISTSAPNDLNIHAVVMAAGRNGIFTVDNYNQGSPRGVVTLLGGMITDFYGPFGTFSGSTPLTGYGRNFVYDRRMLEGFIPPYFPYIGNFISYDDGLDKRLIWQE